MDNPENMKLVDFHKYCRLCKYKDLDGVQEPCNACLTIPSRLNSHMPEEFVRDGSDENG